MFNNPFKKYQTGGSVTDEQRQEATEFVTWIKSNVEGFKDKSVEEIAKSLIDMRKSEEGEKSYQDLYKRFKSSKSKKSKFEDGGKFQQFICKHARGGLVNCGCGGMTLKAADGDQVPEIVPAPTDSTVIAKGPYKGYTIYNTYTTTAPDGSVARYTVAKDNMGQYLRKQEINGNTAILGGYLDENRAWTPEGDVDYTNNPYMQKLFTFTPVQKKQPGGNILYAEDGLSRKQVRADKRLVKQKLREAARGTDTSASDRYQFALNEAKNIGNIQGMSRLERKNAVHDMILGRGQSALKDVNVSTIDLPRVDMSNINLPEVDNSLPDFEITAPVMDYSDIYNNFNDAFAAARKAGLKQFDWNGKPIAVVTDPNWKNRWRNGQNTQPVQEINTPPGPEELERQRQEYWNGVNDEARQIRERTSENALAEYLETHYPNGTERNLITRVFQPYVVRENPNVETSPLFIGPLSPKYTKNEFIVNKRGSYEQGGQIEKHQNDNGIIDHYRNKWVNDWNNIKTGWNNFKNSAFGLIIPTSREELLMSVVPAAKPVYTGAKVAKVAKAARGPLLEFEGDLIKIRPGLTPEQREKARKLAYEIADSRALRKSLPRDLDDAYGMTNGPWSSTFGRHFKLSELNK